MKNIVKVFLIGLILTTSCSEDKTVIQKNTKEINPSTNLSIDSVLRQYKVEFGEEKFNKLEELVIKDYEKDFNNTENAIRYSTVLLANNQHLKAKEICFKALATDTNYSQLYWNIGLCNMMESNRDSGYYYFEKACKKNPNWYYYFWLSRYNDEDGKYNEALVNINKAINIRPKDIDLKVYRAKYKNANSDFLGALQDLKVIPEHRKNDPDVYNILAISYIGIKEFNKAVLYCDTGLDIQSSNVYLLYLRALAYTNINRRKDALMDLKKCADLGSEECRDKYLKLKEGLEKRPE